MALDNAQFMSELSITDPPGTDPLSEGDDQIRTAKRTQFQSFEFVDKAVTKTADEFNDMAQRSGGNVFTGTQQFNTAMIGSDGLVTAPHYAFTLEPSMGMFRNQAGVLGFGVGDEEVFRMALSNVRTGPNTVIRTGGNGSAAAPAFGFQLQTNMGMWREGTSDLRLGTGGAPRLTLTTGSAEFANGLVSVAKAGTTSVAGFHLRDSSNVPRWQFQILTDANGNDMSIRRLNSAGVSQGDMLRFRQSDGLLVMDLATVPTSDPGVTGAIYRSAGDFLILSV